MYLRDDTLPLGYREVNERLPDLGNPAEKRVELRPWAITKLGLVVYERWDSLAVASPVVPVQEWSKRVFVGSLAETKGLRLYDSALSLDRRREFETALARDAEAHPECVMPALNRVSGGVEDYYQNLLKKKSKDDVERDIDEGIKSFCYSDGNSAQLGTSQTFRNTNLQQHINAAFQCFRGTDIATIMTVQSAFAEMFEKLGPSDRVDESSPSAQKMRYDDCMARLDLKSGRLYTWFGSHEVRGRVSKKTDTKPPPTDVAGLLRPGQSVSGNLAAAKNTPPHVRGIDLFERAEKSPFVRGLDMRNLVFGAGRSGSIKVHMLAYRLFAGIDNDELFKQYLLAAIVTLVGKGHHTCHEILSVASHVTGPFLSQREGKDTKAKDRDLGIPDLVKHAYVPGSYLKYLPQSYVTTKHFEDIRERYYDIAVLGHLHGTFATEW
jgi:hypothetical protein